MEPLSQQVGEGELRVPPTARVRQTLFDQLSEPEALVKFAHKDQAVRQPTDDGGTLEIDFERGVEGKLKGLVLGFTRWVFTSGVRSSCSHPHEY